MGTGICLIFRAGNWDFHVFYHWEWDFLNATRNDEILFKDCDWDFNFSAGKMGSGPPPSGPSIEE